MSKTKRIAIYGKGGIGKSTIVSNIAAAYSEDYNVLVIGCDPKADTTRTLVGRRIPTILDIVKEKKNASIEEVLFEGYGNVKCVEKWRPRAWSWMRWKRCYSCNGISGQAGNIFR